MSATNSPRTGALCAAATAGSVRAAGACAGAAGLDATGFAATGAAGGATGLATVPGRKPSPSEVSRSETKSLRTPVRARARARCCLDLCLRRRRVRALSAGSAGASAATGISSTGTSSTAGASGSTAAASSTATGASSIASGSTGCLDWFVDCDFDRWDVVGGQFFDLRFGDWSLLPRQLRGGGLHFGAKLGHLGAIVGDGLELGQSGHGLLGHAMGEIEADFFDGLFDFAGGSFVFPDGACRFGYGDLGLGDFRLGNFGCGLIGLDGDAVVPLGGEIDFGSRSSRLRWTRRRRQIRCRPIRR